MLKSEELEVAFITKYHCKRVETFEPPFKLMAGYDYSFSPKDYWCGRIAHYLSGDKRYRVSTGRCENAKNFDTYEEAVDYAHKLFTGEQIET